MLLNPTIIVPPLPEKQGVIGRIPGVQADENEHIEHRRRGLQAFLKRVSRHPILCACRLFIRFLEAPQTVSEDGDAPAPPPPCRRRARRNVFPGAGQLLICG